MEQIMAKVEMYKDTAGKWRWRAKASNGRIIGASTEGFSSKDACIRNINILSKNLSNRYPVTNENVFVIDNAD